MSDYTVAVTLLVTLASGIILSTWCGYLFTRKASKPITALCYLLGYGAVCLGSLFVQNNRINAGIFFAASSLIIALCYTCKPWISVLNGLVLTGLEHLSALISSLLLGFYTRDFSMYQNRDAIFTSLTVVGMLIYFMLATLVARLIAFKRLADYGGFRAIKLLILPLASIFIAIIVTYVGMYVSLPMWLQMLVYICLGMLFFANIYTLKTYDNAVLTQRENTAVKLALRKEESDAELYRVISEQNDGQRILIHDIKNHLQIISGYAHQGKTEEIEKYIEELGHSEGLAGSTRYSENGILNMVIIKLVRDAKKQDVKVFCDIREKCVEFMEDVDIASLFGNLATNALEAAAKSTERVIEIDISTKPAQKLTVITFANSCDVKPAKTAEGMLISDKGAHHGIGQRSIARIVKKYSGTAENFYDSESKRFEWVIVFKNR